MSNAMQIYAIFGNNAISDISIENPMNKIDVKIVTSRKQYLKWSLKSTFKREKKIFRVIVIKKEKCRININKTIYIVASILDLSKILMQVSTIIILKINMMINLKCC